MVTFNFPAWAFSLHFFFRGKAVRWGTGDSMGFLCPAWWDPKEEELAEMNYSKASEVIQSVIEPRRLGEAEGAMQKHFIKRLWQVLHCGRHVNEQSSPTFAGHFLTLK